MSPEDKAKNTAEQATRIPGSRQQRGPGTPAIQPPPARLSRIRPPS
jgi:hypothetical protein